MSNHMDEIAKMFGKKMHERFTIVRGGKKFDAVFSWMGLELMGGYENPYVELDAFVLMDLLNGEALIVNSEAEVEDEE